MRDSHFNRIRESMNFENRDSMLSEKSSSHIEKDARKSIDSMLDYVMEKAQNMIYEHDFQREFRRMGYEDADADKMSSIAFDVCMKRVDKINDEMTLRKMVDREVRLYFR